MRKIGLFRVCTSVAIAFVCGLSLASLGFAQATIVGERVEFSPASPRVGEPVTVIVYFRVENGPVTPVLNYKVSPVGRGEMESGPSIVMGRLEPGSHSMRFNYNLPSEFPSRKCFDIRYGPQAIIEAACLEGRVAVMSGGTGRRVMAGAAPAPALGLDLQVAGDIGVDPIRLNSAYTGWAGVVKFRVLNTGPANADRIDWEARLWKREEMRAGSAGLVIGNGTISRIAGGGTANEQFRHIFESGTAYLIKIKLDPANRITETNESNNTKDLGFVTPR